MADRFTPEQYKAAGQWMLANLSDPAAIKAKAEELRLSIEELAAAAQTVNPEIKAEDVVNYFKKLDKPTPTPAPVSEERFTPEQYSDAGQWMLQNLGDPNAIKAKADELGLSTSELLTAAQTVNPELTTEDVTKYLNTSTPASTSTSTSSPTVTTDRFTPEQYAAAGQWVLANLGNPAAVKAKADELDISVDELTKAAQTVNPNLTEADITKYLSQASGVDTVVAGGGVDTVKAAGGVDTVVAGGGVDTVVAGGGVDTVTAAGGADTVVAGGGVDTVKAAGGADTVTAAGGADTVVAGGGADTVKSRFTPEQYKAAGQWMLQNLGNPTAIANKAKELGLTITELLTAAQTVNPNLTTNDLAKYFQDALSQSRSANFDTTVRGAPTTDRVGTGVAVTGESGLREGYAPYVQRLLERSSAEADVPFQAYTGTSPLLESAKQGIANLTTPAQFLQGSNLADAAGKGALEYGRYMPTAFSVGTFANPTTGTGTTTGKGAARGGLMSLINYDAGGAVSTGSGTAATPNSYTVPANPNIQPVNYGGQNVTNVQASYMSPYMQNVVDVQQREAKRQADIANQAIGAKAVQAGAFGGSRHGLLESEANRNLMTQLGGIQAKGLQDAYTQGLGQFNVEQGRGLEAQKMSEQSRQFGAELGLKGLQTGIQAGQVLGNLGQQQGQFDLAALKQMADLGTADRNFDYNEFLRAEKYPYENLTFMKNMLTGLPISAAATGIDPMSQALTGGISTIALIDMINKINTGSTGATTTSDRRLKTDIQTIGVLDDGLKVYSYRYKSGGPMQIGVMADEVAVLRPQAYIKGGAGDGFDAVDYSKL